MVVVAIYREPRNAVINKYRFFICQSNCEFEFIFGIDFFTIRINNDDMPPSWGNGPIVNFIITGFYNGLSIPNIVQM